MEQIYDEKNPYKVLKSCGFLVFARNKEGELNFLVMKKKGRNNFDLPKGHQEESETDMDTAKRELREETGIEEGEIRIMETNLFEFKETYFPKYKRFQNRVV